MTNRRLRVGLAAVVTLAVAATTAGVVAADSASRASDAALVADARRLGSEALRARDVDTSLLYAVAALRLDDSTATRSDLLAAIDKVPALVTMVRTPRVTSLAAGDGSDLVLVQAPDRGLLVLDGTTLRTVREVPDVAGAAVLTAPDASFAVAAVAPDRTRAGAAPVALLERSGDPARQQLGGMPPARFVFEDLSISPDSRHLAVFLHSDRNDPAVIGVWDVRAPAEPVALIEAGTWSAPLVDATGERLFVVGERGLGVLDLPGGGEREVRTADALGLPYVDPALALSPDGSLLAVAGGTQVVLLDSATLSRRQVVTVPDGVRRLTFSPSGRLLAVSADETVVMDVSGDGEPVEVFRHDSGRPNGWAAEAAFSPRESTLYTSHFDGSVRAWDLAGGRGFLDVVRLRSDAAKDGFGGRVSTDGRRVLYCGAGPDPGFVVASVSDGATTAYTSSGMRARGYLDCAISAEGDLVTMTTADPRVAVWDAAGNLVAARTLAGGEAATFSWFTDDGGLAVGTTKARIHVLDARTLEPRRAPIAVPGGGTVSGFVLRPGSHEALTGPGEGTVIDLETGRSRPAGLGVEYLGAAYSPDGARLAVTTRDGSVGLWDARAGRWLAAPTDAQPFAGHAPTFSPDGREFAVTEQDRVGRWDGVTGAFLGAVTVGEQSLAGYTAGGSELVLAGASGALYTWDLDPASWVAAACRMAGRDLTDEEWRAQLPGRDRVPVCPRTP